MFKDKLYATFSYYDIQVKDQVYVVYTATSQTPFQDGAQNSSRGSTLAFGVLVPILGLGLNGLWAATYGSFGARRLKGDSFPAESHPDDREIG